MPVSTFCLQIAFRRIPAAFPHSSPTPPLCHRADAANCCGLPSAHGCGLPSLFFEDAQAWEDWLAGEHADAAGVWLKFAKKGTGIASLHYAGALDVALCYGWIDGQSKRVDDEYYLQKFTPRRGRSKWSKVNRDKVAALTAAGRMRPAGVAEVERAKADGRWEAAYDPPSKATVPDDLQEALDANAAAKDFFATLNSANRYAILFRIQDAKRPETRVRRIAKFVDMLSRGETIH